MIALRISKDWGQTPSWFYTLDREMQITLIADKVLDTETNEDRDKRRDRHARDKNKKRVND